MADVEDSVTPQLPRLMYERLDEFGIDFSVVYPSQGLLCAHVRDDEDRLIATRAMNEMHAELYNREYGDRLAVPAVIPMKRPEEALAELEHAVRVLGFKVAMFPFGVWRPIPALVERFPGIEEYGPDGLWLDCYGTDSEYDYDPVFRQVHRARRRLHQPRRGGAERALGQPLDLELDLQPHRQPALAAEHAVQVAVPGRCHAPLPAAQPRLPRVRRGLGRHAVVRQVGHWEKRNLDALAVVDPARLDRKRAEELLLEYGGKRFEGRVWEQPRCFPVEADPPRPGESLDDFAPMQIRRKEDLGELFSRFYFGCEADDRMNAVAFQTRDQPLRHAAQRDLQLRHRPLRRARHDARASRRPSSWSRTAR